MQLLPTATLTMTVLLLGCAGEPTRSDDAGLGAKRSVRVVAARATSQAVDEDVIGTLHARNVAAIAASITGTIRSLDVTIGSRVHAGRVLMTLAAGEIDAKADQATAMLAQADLEMKRAERLKDSQAITPSAYDAALAQFRVAEATLAEARAMRGYTTLRAPFAGVITAKQCNVGDLALPGKTLLVLESPGVLRLEAAVPEALAHVLHMGDVLTARIDSIASPLSVTVSELGASADPVSRTVLVKLDVPNLPQLRAGMFGRLSVHTGEAKVIVVPASAVVRRGQMELVYVAVDATARLRIIRTGRSHGDTVEVLAGLDDGEPVVADIDADLVDGQRLEVIP